MADLRSSMPILEDSSTQAGLPIHKVLQGDALAAKNAVPVLGFKNLAGDLRYPVVNDSDELIVSTTSVQIACLSATGEVAGNAAYTDIASITLLPDTEYKQIGYIVSCFRDAVFKFVQIDDAVTTILGYAQVGAGDLTDSCELACLALTAGSTGTQTLKIQAKCTNALSDMRATLTVLEVQV